MSRLANQCHSRHRQLAPLMEKSPSRGLLQTLHPSPPRQPARAGHPRPPARCRRRQTGQNARQSSRAASAVMGRKRARAARGGGGGGEGCSSGHFLSHYRKAKPPHGRGRLFQLLPVWFFSLSSRLASL
jgi:hypothetical protein